MEVVAIKTRIFAEGENLEAFIVEHVPRIADGSVLVVTSKIVALAEGRTAEIAEKERLIQDESEVALKTKWVWLTVKDGSVLANAGIDSSNADGRIILLPRDSMQAARDVRVSLMKRYGLAHLGIIITDSRVYPLRAGVVGVALGYAGFKAIRDYRGKDDLFGRPFEYSRTNVADSLATAGVVLMGEGAERQPLALIADAPVEFTDNVDADEVKIPLKTISTCRF